MKELSSEFKDSMRELLGEEAETLFKALDSDPVTAVRLNKRKPGASFPDTEPVEWCESGFYLSSRPDFILDPLLHAGAYYVQDASSMIYETVVKRLVPKFYPDMSGKVKVLDLCAAPGGKTTAMINALPDGSEITANEYTPKRVAALKENLAKWGYQEITVTNKDSAYFAGMENEFDIVAVDSPCSGEGMMRKDETARTQWTPNLVSKCATLQKDILTNAEKALKPGGFLIYSTCTFNREENEGNADFIYNELKLEPIDMEFPQEWGILPGIKTDLPVYRFMPHKTKGEGLFLAVFRKPGEWEPSRFNKLNIRNEASAHPKVDVDKATALAYLRRESIVLPTEAPLGIVTITYKDLPLGEAKNIGKRANNLYPKNWRILKQ